MFSRRQPLTLSRKLREMIWPSMGFRRSLAYTGHRLMRIKDSTHALALGLAIGTAISFTPTPGLHILQAAALAWLLRGNVVASFIGTLVGNPFTLPLMWWISFKAGEIFFAALGFEVSEMPAHINFTFSEITRDFMGLFLPWVTGGYAMALFSGPPCYAVFYWLVIQARRRRIKWKQNRMHRIARTITEPQP